MQPYAYVTHALQYRFMKLMITNCSFIRRIRNDSQPGTTHNNRSKNKNSVTNFITKEYLGAVGNRQFYKTCLAISRADGNKAEGKQRISDSTENEIILNLENPLAHFDYTINLIIIFC